MEKRKGLLILYLGKEGNVNDWEAFDGILDEAIAHVKSDNRWSNYGRRGAVIVYAQKIFEIGSKYIEQIYTYEPDAKQW